MIFVLKKITVWEYDRNNSLINFLSESGVYITARGYRNLNSREDILLKDVLFEGHRGDWKPMIYMLDKDLSKKRILNMIMSEKFSILHDYSEFMIADLDHLVAFSSQYNGHIGRLEITGFNNEYSFILYHENGYSKSFDSGLCIEKTKRNHIYEKGTILLLVKKEF